MFGRIAAALYGLFCYATGMAALGYTALWLINLVPNALDAPATGSLATGLAINVLLVVLFALQHSGMARPRFKAWFTRFVPAAIERSTYVLASSVAMALFFAFWQPLGVDLWRIETGAGYVAVLAAYAGAWAVLVSATFCVNHFDLFGLRQVWLRLRGQGYRELSFTTRGLYALVRHPIYLGWFLVLWITPVMTISHLFFALATSAYILWAVRLEERDLLRSLPEYASYKEQVPMVVPGLKPSQSGAAASAE